MITEKEYEANRKLYNTVCEELVKMNNWTYRVIPGSVMNGYDGEVNGTKYMLDVPNKSQHNIWFGEVRTALDTKWCFAHEAINKLFKVLDYAEY
jgi:hypothetical protein